MVDIIVTSASGELAVKSELAAEPTLYDVDITSVATELVSAILYASIAEEIGTATETVMPDRASDIDALAR